jgi:hypothetical protein
VTNNSEYILKEVELEITSRPDGKTAEWDLVHLEKSQGFFLPHEQLASACGKLEIHHPDNNKWTFKVAGTSGWHQ